jgi:hypothetical protein
MAWPSLIAQMIITSNLTGLPSALLGVTWNASP